MRIDKQILGWGISSLLHGIVMATLNIQDSWSKYAGHGADFLFYPGIISIIVTFILIANKHPQKDRHLYNLFKRWDVKLKHQAYTTAVLFAGVAGYSVNSDIEFVSVMHYVFTGLAMLSSYLILIFYPKSKSKRALYTKMALAGILAFILGFGFDLYTIGWAEVGLTIPLFLFLLWTARED